MLTALEEDIRQFANVCPDLLGTPLGVVKNHHNIYVIEMTSARPTKNAFLPLKILETALMFALDMSVAKALIVLEGTIEPNVNVFRDTHE